MGRGGDDITYGPFLSVKQNERARVDHVKSECADRFLSVFFFLS